MERRPDRQAPPAAPATPEAQLRSLAEAEARYRAILRSVPLVQWATDRHGTFTLSEGLGLAALGLKPGQIVGRTVAEVYDDNPGVLGDFERALAGETFVSENRVGARVYASHWGPIRDEAGEIVGVTGIARDVTEERALREQVARAQKLESLGRLAGGVAHDFNNLLTVVLACAEVLREEAAAGRPASLEDVEEIAIAGARARDLVRQLLAFARRQAVALAPTDVGLALRGSEKLLRRALGEDVALSITVAPDLWPVRCDPGQLEQVFLNLALNARDAMPGGGRVAIEARNARVPGDPPIAPPARPGDWVRVTVKDTGVGMADEVKAHLFEPFFTTKEPGAGTGLGLATVYGAIAQAGGHIHVESAPGRGTTFELCLPRCERPVLTPPPLPAPGKVGGTERILVVEDDPLVRSVTRRTLETAGYQVVVARDGAEALERAGEPGATFELVVTDVVMPGMTGAALARELAARRPGQKVLFVSGYSREVMAERGLEEEAPRLLPKPFTATTLLARVRQVLDE
jgi:PAS domain S-box-containing protein